MIIGTMFLGLGFVASLVAIAALAMGHRMGEKAGEPVTNAGYIATFTAAASVTVSTFVLLFAGMRHDFRFEYVAYNHSTDVSSLSWLYRFSTLWAGREGSLLFWAWLLALFIAYVAYRRMTVTDPLSNIALLISNAVLALFSAAMLFSQPNNPFKATPAEMLGPGGELLSNTAMNPLLQHWAMILHPPTLFVGYAGLTIPFAYAIAALIIGDGSRRWVDIVDRITVFSWFFLGAGIGLGSVWAYVVLGWGGYWAWDPVENASLLPWLTGVGLIHSFTVYRRRGGFKRWAIFNAAFTFSVVILGTFITRSGIVQSVHAFQEDPVSKWLFGFMILAPIVMVVIGLMLRKEEFAGNDDFDSLMSKDAAYYFNNLLMIVSTIIVAYMTVTSALPAWMPFGGQSIGIATYDLLARPVGILYALILAFCPILAWGKTDLQTFWSRAKWPFVTAAVIFAALVAEWYLVLRPIYDFMVAQGGKGATNFQIYGPSWIYHGLALLGLLAGSLIVAQAVWLFIEGAKRRAAAKGESFGAAFFGILTQARTQSGGYIAHIGIGIILIGLVGSAMYVRDVKTLLPYEEGQSFSASNYTFTFQGIQERQLPNGDVDSIATFAVAKDGRSIGTVTPGLTSFARQGQTRLNAAVLSEPLRDIFMVWEGNQESATGGQELSINVKINPLIWFAWGGFLILQLGTMLAMWPKRRGKLAAAAA